MQSQTVTSIVLALALITWFHGVLLSGQNITTHDLQRDITRVVTDPKSDIYVGGVNFVAQFTNKLENLIMRISIGPVYETKHCAPNPAPCNNTVRVLEFIKELGLLLVCGTAYGGTCTLHSLSDLSYWYCLVGNLDQDAAVFTSHDHKTTVVHLLPSVYDFLPTLTQTTADDYECRPHNFSHDFLNLADNRFIARVKETKIEKRSNPNASRDFLSPSIRVMIAGNIQRSDVMTPVTLSMRSIRISDNYFIIDYLRDQVTQQKGIDVKPNIKSTFYIDYKLSFSWGNFSYFLTVQEEMDNANKITVTKLSRVPNNSSQIVPFVEVNLRCEQNRTTHNIATSATFVLTDIHLDGTFVPTPVLVVAFGSGVTPNSTTADPSKGGSVCVFFINELAKREFDLTLKFCNDGDTWLAETPYWINGASDKCQTVNLTGQTNMYVKSTMAVNQKSLLNVSAFISAIYSYVPKINNNPDSKFSNIIDVFFITGTGSMEKMTLVVDSPDKPEVTSSVLNVNMEFPLGKELMDRRLTPVGFVDDFWSNLYLAVGSKILVMSVNFCRQFHTCEECITSRDDFTCHWCSQLNVCQDAKLDCSGKLEGTCPPKLEKFSPDLVPTDGGSLLTLYVANFGRMMNYTPSINVTMCGRPCQVNSTNHDSISCIVPRCEQCSNTIPTDCIVTVALVSVLMNYSATMSSSSLPGNPTVKYVSPKLKSYTPHFGPIYGGTLLEFKGQYLRSGTKRRIFVAGISCDIINETLPNMDELRCLTGKQPSGKPSGGNVTVHIDHFKSIYKTSFYYKPNPVITRIKSANTIQSGGTEIIVTGSNFSSASNFELVIIYNDTVTNNKFVIRVKCSLKNTTTQLRCVTPNVYNMTSPYFTKHPTAGQVNAKMVIVMDGGQLVAPGSPTPMNLLIHRDPEFNSVSSLDQTLSPSHSNLTLRGRYLPAWMDKHDIKVTVGDVTCPVRVVTSDHLVCNAHKLVENIRHEKNLTGSKDIPGGGNDNTTSTLSTTVEPGAAQSIVLINDIPRMNYTRNTFTSANITTPTSPPPTDSNASTPRPLTDQHEHFDHVVVVEIGNYRRELGSVRVSLATPDDVASSKLKMYIGAGAAGLVIVMLLAATVTLLIRVKRSKKHKGGAMAKPTLKQILEKVVETNKVEDMDKIIVTLDRLTVGRSIGSGNFGCVYEGMLEFGPGIPAQKVAIKTLQDPLSHNLDLLGFVQEAVIMREFRHPNVLGLVGLAEKEPGVPYVILPFMERGDLLTYIRDASVNLSLHDVIKFGADIASGMAYLSALKLVHRDLAARNCMLDDILRVKVADFGLCRDIYEKGYYTSDNKKKLPIRWMALESIEHGAYSTKSDVWSLGVVLWELLTRGVVPYPGVDGWDIINFLRHRRLAPPHFCPDALYSLMMLCWAKDPNKRPTFKTLQMELLLLIGQSPQDTPVESPKRESAVNVYVKMPSDKLESAEGSRSSKAIKELTFEEKDPKSENNETSVKNREPSLEKKGSNVVKPIPKVRITKAGLKNNPVSEDSEQSASSDPNKTQGDGQDRTKKTYSDILSVPTINVVKNVMITIPACYNHRDVSKTAAGVYIQLVDNYEPPPKFFSPFHKASKRDSKRAADKRSTLHAPGSDKRAAADDMPEFVRLGKDGAYFELESKAARLSAISDTGSRSSATLQTASSFGSLLDAGSSNRVSSGGSNVSSAHGQGSRVGSQNMQVTYKRSPLADKSLSASCDLNLSLNLKENPP